MTANQTIVCNLDPNSANKWLGQPGGAGTAFVYGSSAAAVAFTDLQSAQRVAEALNGVAVPSLALNLWVAR